LTTTRPSRSHDPPRRSLPSSTAIRAFPARRQHDKGILRFITHAPEGDVIDDYTTLVWKPLCREVAKLQIALLRSVDLPVAKCANSLDRDLDRVTGRVTGGGLETKNPPQVPGIPGEL
jgi:hypothetical protein